MQLPVDSPHSEHLMQKAFPCLDDFMKSEILDVPPDLVREELKCGLINKTIFATTDCQISNTGNICTFV